MENMYKKKSTSSYSTSDTDRTSDYNTSIRLSGFSNCSGNQAAAGDFKAERDVVKVRYTENTARTNYHSRYIWSREELLDKIKDDVTSIQQQEKYLKHQEGKKQRNKQLIDHLNSLSETDRKETLNKRRECKRLEKERARYKEIVTGHKKEVKNSSARYVMAQRLNDDLTQQRKQLDKKRDWLKRQERERGIDDDFINEYMSAQRLLEREQEKKENLKKKWMWYKRETAKAKNEWDIRKVNTSADKSLPAIGSNTKNLISERVNDEAASTITDIIKQRDGYVHELNDTHLIPKPPEEPRTDVGIVNRFRRKTRPKH